ncbi:hypothetical protein CGRA01v4_14630 [Colletotrichum graminicola]|nr:hypothetical protein CGRA01v4_14630 [Colletotrichum graminicola]
MAFERLWVVWKSASVLSTFASHHVSLLSLARFKVSVVATPWFGRVAIGVRTVIRPTGGILTLFHELFFSVIMNCFLRSSLSLQPALMPNSQIQVLGIRVDVVK